MSKMKDAINKLYYKAIERNGRKDSDIDFNTLPGTIVVVTDGDNESKVIIDDGENLRYMVPNKVYTVVDDGGAY